MTLQRLSVLLDERLEVLTVGQLRVALHAHAESLPVGQRQAFLDIFRAAVVAPSEPPDRSWPVEEDPLLVDIDAFAAAVASGSYYEGYGWDPDLRDQRSFGDESWVGEMDGLIGDAQQAFLCGELGRARAAYGRLLNALRLDEEVGTFCGPEPVEDMLATSIPEAQARHLRAVYETEGADERAEVLAEQWLSVPGWRDTPTLQGLREALAEDVPDLETFLPRWISALAARDEGGPLVRRLLAEAVELSRGVDGLGELALAGGPGQAERCADWIGALRRAGRGSDAAEAARHALEVLPTGGHVRAGIADQLAELSGGQADAHLAARQEAWRAAATQQRLLELARAATAVDDVERVLTVEAEAVPSDALAGRLHAALLLLAGRADEAMALLGVRQTWDPREGAGRVVLPYLLAAGCSGPSSPTWTGSRLHRLLGSVDDPHSWNWTTARPHTADGSGDSGSSLSGLLEDRIVRDPVPPERRRVFLEAALREVDHRVDTVVGGQHRARYAEVAWLVACALEAVVMERDDGAGRTYLATTRNRYPRHTAFRRALDRSVAGRPGPASPSVR